MFCPNCGSEVKCGAKYCGNCGSRINEYPEPKLIEAQSRLDEGDETYIDSRQHKKKFIPFVVLVVIFIITAVVLFVTNQEKQKKEDAKAIATAISAEYRLDRLVEIQKILNQQYYDKEDLDRRVRRDIPDAILGYDEKGNAIFYTRINEILEDEIKKCELQIQLGEYAKERQNIS